MKLSTAQRAPLPSPATVVKDATFSPKLWWVHSRAKVDHSQRHAGTTNTASYLGENLVLSPSPGDSAQCLEPSFVVITGEEELLASRV